MKLPEKVTLRGYNPTYKGHKRQIEKALELLSHSERPLIYAGGGIISSNASPELMEFATLASIPVTTTLMGIGCIPCHHPLNLGMLGMHGTEYANFAVTECDLMIAIGARFDDRVTGKIDTFAPHAKIIHIDIDPAEIGKNKRVDVPIVGDVKAVLQDLLALMKKRDAHEIWLKKIKHWKQHHPLKCPKNGALHPQYIIRTLSDLVKDKAVIVSEVGQNQMWTAQHFCFHNPRTWITSGGLGTMGYGLPAAMGAHFARPDVPVFDIAGDGSIQMNIQEFGTIASNKIPVKVAILNNMYLGMVRQWQELFYDHRYSFTELPPVDFVKIANAYGIEGMRVESPDDVLPALQASLDCDGPFVMDFRIEREENVFPMVPAGAAINEMIGGHPRIMKPHTLSILVENKAGVLSRVTGLFSRRGFNIESLAVGPCEEPDMSRITIVVIGDDEKIEQVMKQLNKLIDIIKVSDLTDSERVERELALIKVTAELGTSRAEIMQIASIFRAPIVDVGAKTLILQVIGDTDKIDALEKLLRQYGIKEFVRTGRWESCADQRR